MKLLIILVALVSLSSTVPLSKNNDIITSADEYNDKFEGDMILTTEQEQVLSGQIRTGLINIQARWPNNRVPYTIPEGLFNEQQTNYIHDALAELAQVSCLEFVQHVEGVDEGYVYFQANSDGCYSSVGYQRGNAQRINLTPNSVENGCFRKATIQHEMLHSLGFYHMQSAHDRDSYVRIMWENIEDGYAHNFNTYDENTITHFGIPYDTSSVMHYGPYGFSKNGYVTILPNVASDMDIIGQRQQLSDSDIAKLNAMYECAAPAN